MNETQTRETPERDAEASRGASREDRATRRGRWRKLLVAAGVMVVLGLLVLAFLPDPVPADFARVERGPLEVTLDEEGETRVRDRYVVSAPVAGKVLRIELEPGDPVTAGETALAVFQPSPPSFLDARSEAEAGARVRAARSAVGRVRAELERARSELRFAEAEAERYRRLAAEEIVSAERLDTALLDLERRGRAVDAAEFAVRVAEHELEQAEAALLRQARGGDGSGEGSGEGRQEPIVLTSPVDGVVLGRMRESESVVPVGEPLLEVADPSQLEIVSDFLSTDAVRIDPGDPVHIEHWGGDVTLEGVVRRVEPSGFTKISALGVEEQRVNVIIDFADPREAWQALGDGFRVEVEVVVWRDDDVVRVPTSALFRHGDDGGETGWAVFAVESGSGPVAEPVEEGTARLVPVEIGHRNGLVAEVLSGLEPGTLVVVHPSEKIEDGAEVEARQTGDG